MPYGTANITHENDVLNLVQGLMGTLGTISLFISIRWAGSPVTQTSNFLNDVVSRVEIL